MNGPERNQPGPDGKRLALALLLSLAVLTIYSKYLAPPPPELPDTPPIEVAEDGREPRDETGDAPEAIAGTVGTDSAEGGSVAPAEVSSEAAIEDPQTRAITLESPLYEVRISNVGGTITSWKLRNYQKTVVAPGEEPSGPVDLYGYEGAAAIGPLAVVTGRSDRDAELARARYRLQGEDQVLGPDDTAEVVLTWADGNGARIEKTLSFHGDSYAVEVRVEARLEERDAFLTLGPGLERAVADGNPRNYDGRVVAYVGDDREVYAAPEVPLKDIRSVGGRLWPVEKWLEKLDQAEAVQRFGGASWVGLERNYFASIALLDRVAGVPIAYPVLSGVDDETAQLNVGLPLDRETSFTWFVGPKDSTILKAVHPSLEEAVEWGFFASLARILFSALEFFHGYVGNWGLAIVIVTLLIKLIFVPLTVKQLQTAQKMAKLQPQLKALEAKYARMKADPKKRAEAQQKMNAERMEIMQREGVNPLAGCLPLLLYMPFLWGFYQILQIAIELRHAPFLLWIQDLSAKDPVYVTPILMVISMLVQQSITPSTADPMQRRIFMFMPLVFGFIFKDMAAGLVLFWLTQNALSIVQQLIMNKLSDAKDREEKSRKQLKRKTA